MDWEGRGGGEVNRAGSAYTVGLHASTVWAKPIGETYDGNPPTDHSVLDQHRRRDSV